MSKPGNVTIENAQILFRNFEGREDAYNAKGNRNFCVILPDDVAEDMKKDGWNVKRLRPQDDDATEGDAYVQVSVSFKRRPPKVVLITSKGRISLGEDIVEILDWVDIANVDLILNPYEWSVNGKTGIKAYVKSLFITQDEDELDRKYADVPEIDMGGKPLEIESAEPDYIEGEVVDD